VAAVKARYDADVNALYLAVTQYSVARTVQLDDWTFADLDQDGHLCGIEVLSPSRTWPLDEILGRYSCSPGAEAELRAGWPDKYRRVATT
jgi:uncharacterized protein YuzE